MRADSFCQQPFRAVSLNPSSASDAVSPLPGPALYQPGPRLGVAFGQVLHVQHTIGPEMAEVLAQFTPRGHQPRVVKKTHGKRPDAAARGLTGFVAVVQPDRVFAPDGLAQRRQPGILKTVGTENGNA